MAGSVQPVQRRRSDGLALTDGRRSLDPARFAELSAQAAACIRVVGIRRCGLLADNGIDWVVADRALAEAGLLNVPLPQQFSAAQLRHAIDDAGLDAVLTDNPATIDSLGQGFVAGKPLPDTGLYLMRRLLQRPPAELPPGTVKITYTSGSTAEPKGVCLTRGAISAVTGSLTLLSQSLGLRRHLALLPLSTLLENIAGVLVSQAAGATCLLPPAIATGVTATAVDPPRFLQTLTDQRPDSLILVPQLLQVLVTAGHNGWQPPDSLRFIAVGGARVAGELLTAAVDIGLPVYEGYGLSECASVVALNTPTAHRPGSVGRPLPHARVRIDADGQILVAGAVMAGYAGGEPVAGGEIATGDLGELDEDGFLYVYGRRKNMFITAFGRNVCPEWIEAELTADGCLAQAMAVGEARPWNVAIISPCHAGITQAEVEQAITAANLRLPEHARIRRWILATEPFSCQNGLLTANGRLRRAAIEQKYREPVERLYQDVPVS